MVTPLYNLCLSESVVQGRWHIRAAGADRATRFPIPSKPASRVTTRPSASAISSYPKPLRYLNVPPAANGDRSLCKDGGHRKADRPIAYPCRKPRTNRWYQQTSCHSAKAPRRCGRDWLPRRKGRKGHGELSGAETQHGQFTIGRYQQPFGRDLREKLLLSCSFSGRRIRVVVIERKAVVFYGKSRPEKLKPAHLV